MTKTLAEWQKGMPSDLKIKHDAMSRDAALHAAKELEDEAMKCDYFGNTCEIRGPDRLAQAATNFSERAEYFRALAASKPPFAKSPSGKVVLP